MVYLRCQLKHTSRLIEAPRYSRTFLFSFGPPPRLKGIMRLFILETSVCIHKLLWALAQLTKSCELLQWQTTRCRGCRWYGLPDRKVLALLKDYVLVIRFSNIMQCENPNGGDRVLWGKVRKPLQSVQSNHGQPCPRLWTILSIQYLEYPKYLITINYYCWVDNYFNWD